MKSKQRKKKKKKKTDKHNGISKQVLNTKNEVLVTQLCLTLCDPMERSPADFSVHVGFSRQEYWSG